MFSYSPDNEDELRLQKDDIIEVLDEEEEGWWRGRIIQRSSDKEVLPTPNAEGVFPSNFVKVVDESPLDSKEKRLNDIKRRNSEAGRKCI